MSKNPSVCECDDQTHRKVNICGTDFYQCQECFSIVEIPSKPDQTVKTSLFERVARWIGEGLAEINCDDLESEIERGRDESMKKLFCIALCILMGAIIVSVLLAPAVVK